VTLVRPTLLSWVGNHGRDAQIQAEAGRLARAYLEDPKSVDASIAGTVLGLAAQTGDRALFDTYKQRFEAAKVPAERGRFLAALGNFRDPASIEAALQYAVEGPLRPQEITRLPGSIATTATGRDRAYRWMTGKLRDAREAPVQGVRGLLAGLRRRLRIRALGSSAGLFRHARTR
jgi:hypothetical protein